MPIRYIEINLPFGVSDEVLDEIQHLNGGLNHHSVRLDDRSMLELLRRLNLELRSYRTMTAKPSKKD